MWLYTVARAIPDVLANETIERFLVEPFCKIERADSAIASCVRFVRADG